ncbi:MAG: Druantia anti-phage system protein DruA [Bacillota bacterium]
MSTSALNSLVVRPIRPDEEPTWNTLMATHHYLGFERLVGESLKYVALLEGEWVALIAWGTAAFKCAARDQWIGWSREQQWQRLKFLANNQRCLILPHVHQPNLASKCLALNLRRLSADGQASFGHPVLLAETFVDPSRFQGTWLPLGQTRGFGLSSSRYYHHGQPKTVWVRPLHRRARALLTALFTAPILQGKGGIRLDLNTVKIEKAGGLLDYLRKLPDPRRRRGIRHSQVAILAVAICAVLCGHRSYVAIGEWAADQPQGVLQRAVITLRVATFHPVSPPFAVPSKRLIPTWLTG